MRPRLPGDLGRRRDGTTAVEYALLVGLIAIVVALALPSVSGVLNATFNTLSTLFAGVGP